MEFTFDELDEELALETEKNEGGSFGVLDTGVYDVVINFASLSKTKKGNNTLALDITTADGHRTTLWSCFGTMDKFWASGAENKYGYSDFQAFRAVLGLKTLTPVPYSLKKDDGSLIKELTVVKELHGKKCVLAIQKELDIYNGEVSEKNIIKKTFNEKGQTLIEMKANEPASKRDGVASRLKDKHTTAYKAQGSAPAEEEPEEMSGLL